MFFLSKAMGKKDILEIEGIKFQVDLFDSFSKELQCQFLASALASGEANEEAATDSEEAATDSEEAATDSEEAATDSEEAATDSEEAAADSEEAAADSEEAAADMELFIYMLKCWKEGNAEELAKMVKTDDAGSEELKEFNEKLWISRDNNMAEKVRGYLADPEKRTYFVVVGAGHMVGESGIVAQLEDEFEIEQIK